MCDICGRINGCHSRCPNYYSSSPITCCYCEEPIDAGEEYLENEFGECRHIDCFSSARKILEWKGIEIKVNGDVYEKN